MKALSSSSAKHGLKLFLLSFFLLSLSLNAQTAFRKGALYHIISTQSGQTLTIKEQGGVELGKFDEAKGGCQFTLSQLSGSWRIIAPFGGNLALRTEGDALATGENNGSDEAQLWKIEQNGKHALLVPTNRPDRALAVQGKSLVLIEKAKATGNRAAQFDILPSKTSGFDADAVYRIRSLGQAGKVLGNGDSGENNAKIVSEKVDTLNRGQYWSIKMLDLERRVVVGGFYSQNFDDGGGNASIDYLLQWTGEEGVWNNAKFYFEPLQGVADAYILRSCAANKKDKMYALDADGILKSVNYDARNKAAWFTFDEVEKPKIQAPKWEDETIFAEHKEPAVATYTPYRSEAAMVADKTYYDTPWVEPQNDCYLSLDGTWRFHFSSEPSGRPLDFYKENYNVSAWDTIPVPSCWEMQGYDHPMYCNVEYPHANTPPYIKARPYYNDGGKNYGVNPTGSYVRTFTLPQDWQQGRTFIHFGGIYSAASVWINGQHVGYTQGANNVSEFDISKYLRAGGNRLAVEVMKWSDGSYIECQDMFRYGGIFRSVYLFNTPRAAVRDHYVTTDLSADLSRATVNVRLALDNRDKLSQTKRIVARLFDPAGNEVGQTQTEADFLKTDSLTLTLPVQNVQLWSAEKPALYTLRIIQKASTGADEMAFSTKIGFRTIEIKHSLLYINGERVFLKGTNRHDTSPVHGKSVTVGEMLGDVLLMKRSNINTIRTSHYPNDARMYAMFDYYGLYCVDEADLEDHANQSISDRKSWIPAFTDRIDRLVRRDRNHPSVIIWSLGNESGNGSNFRYCYDTAHQLDSRPIHYEGTRLNGSYGGGRFSDFYSKMYPGMAWMRANTSGLDKPMFICEYGHAMGNAIGNLREYWDVIENSNATIGGCIWEWVDHSIYDPQEMKKGIRRIHTGYDYPGPHQGNFCSDGILDATRTPNAKLAEVKAAYQYVKFGALEIDKEKNSVSLTLRNAYAFQNLSAFNLTYETVKDGNIVSTKKLKLPAVAAGDSTTLTLKLGGVNLRKAAAAGEEVLLNLHVTLRSATRYAEAGHEVALHQYTLQKRGALPALKADAAAGELAMTDGAGKVMIGNEHVQLAFDEETAQLVGLAFDGRDVIADGQGFVYENHRWIENDRYGNTDNGLEANGTLKVTQRSGLTVVQTERHGSLCDTRIEYTLYPQGIVEAEAHFTPHRDDLRRAGLQCFLDSSLSRVNYYAYGPWENSCDRKDGVVVGRYTTDVAGLHNFTVKPQSSGGREGLRELTLTDKNGWGIKIEAEGTVNFSGQQNTDQDLMNAPHTWELTPRPYNVFHFDAWTRGIGNASCGQDVDTLPQYRVPNQPLTYKLRISKVQ